MRSLLDYFNILLSRQFVFISGWGTRQVVEERLVFFFI